MTDFELIPETGWAGAANERIPPPGDGSGLILSSLSKVAKRFGRSRVPRIFPALHKHPKLFWAWLHFASGLMPRGKLAATMREQCILRTAWLCRNRYEWGQHVAIALSVGIRDEDILAITRGPSAMRAEQDQALMQACDELFSGHQIEDATWTALSVFLDEPRRIELVMLIGHYQMLAGFLNTAGLALDPDMESTLAEFHQRIATIVGP